MSTRYTIERRAGCALVFGSMPAADLAAFMLNECKETPGAVMDSNLARMAGADFAMGTEEDTLALRATLAEQIVAQMRREHPALSEAAVRWLAVGEHGRSAEAMFRHLTGEHGVGEAEPGAHPHDPDDLRRCRLLLEQVPELQDAFKARMGTLSPVWGRLASAWDSLCASMDQETPAWRQSSGRPHHTYDLLQGVLDGRSEKRPARRP